MKTDPLKRSFSFPNYEKSYYLPISKRYKGLVGWDLDAFKKDQLQRSISWQMGDKTTDGLEHCYRYCSRFYFEKNYGDKSDDTNAAIKHIDVRYDEERGKINLEFKLAENDRYNYRVALASLDTTNPDEIENLGLFLIEVAKKEKEVHQHTLKALHWADDRTFKTRSKSPPSDLIFLGADYEQEEPQED